MIWTLAFWQGAGERALKTFVQTFIPALLLALGASSTGTLNVWTAPWVASLQIATGVGLGAAFLSLCTSLGNASFTAGASKIVSTAAATTADPAVITSVADATGPLPALDSGSDSSGSSGVPPIVDQPAQ